ncbi:hypothetical protein CANCADRAFT_147601 [Tortispora caseinolytica NRRL Y-17796]|uniref:Plasma membrane fusion protein PRM1 n=1 Tax=Tortispora caseinolytica NRRL Y-17796 TaxID=767744 RepID=A0A1E4TLC1_9ASCO|nr:hypothetical protein CANCADRAFT_147601 [Tortispora caseinolytica NRRL Y-17796]
METHSLNTVPEFASGVSQDVSQAVVELTENSVQHFGEVLSIIVSFFGRTYICLFSLIATAAAELALNAAEEVLTFANNTLMSVDTIIQESINTANTALESVSSSLEGMTTFFSGESVDIPTISIPNVTALANLTIPDSVFDAISNAKADIPDFKDLQNDFTDLAKSPFEYLSNQIDNLFVDYTYPDTNYSKYAVEYSQISCANADDKYWQGIKHTINKSTYTAAALIFVLALLVAIGFAVYENIAYRRLNVNVKETTDNSDQVESYYAGKNSLAFHFQRKFISKNSTYAAQYRWFVSFVLSSKMMFMLYLGIIMSFSYIIIYCIVTNISTLSDGFNTQSSQTALSALAANTTNSWKNSSNSMIGLIETDVNTRILGPVHNTTTQLNNTISKFETSIESTIDSVFGNSFLADAVSDIAYCLILRKLEFLSSVMDSLANHSQVKLYRFNTSSNPSALADTVATSSSTFSKLLQMSNYILCMANTRNSSSAGPAERKSFI